MRFALLLFILATTSYVSAKPQQLKADLDFLISLPQAYAQTPADLEKKFPKGKRKRSIYFQWLNKEKSRAIFKRHLSSDFKIDITVLEGTVPIEELIVDFQDGKFLGVTVSVFNRGDGGKISNEEFSRRFTLLEKHLGEQLKARPRERSGNIKKGIMTHGYSWESARGKAVLLCNPDIEDPLQPRVKEFMRLRLSRKNSKGIYQAAMEERSIATVRKSALAQNVTKDDGNVFIKDLPMVDQGAKGYCVVASAQRLFEYYGIACDMHQLAQLAKSDPAQGTNSIYINQQLGQIDYLFKTRFSCFAVSHENGLVELEDGKYVGDKVSRRSYDKFIKKNIDKGIPILWSMTLGKKPEAPAISPQASGGHMRMIIGYNEKEKRTIFSDSWGSGHEFKSMDADDAYQVTTGLYLMQPTVN